MDKIFKNDKIMGIIAIATFALVALMVFRQKKASAAIETPVGNQQEEVE